MNCTICTKSLGFIGKFTSGLGVKKKKHFVSCVEGLTLNEYI